MAPGTAILVFARAPVAGAAKTRLIPALGAARAAALAERFLQHAVGEAVAAGVGPVSLCTTPDSTHPAFIAARQRHGIALQDQGEGDLGQRMHRALAAALEHHAAAIVIGTDAPALDAALLRQAAAALAAREAAFVPAADGGYALVGLTRPAPGLFEGMRWSHAQVMADTRVRLAALGLRHAELPTVADVDEPADLRHVPAAWLEALATIER